MNPRKKFPKYLLNVICNIEQAQQESYYDFIRNLLPYMDILHHDLIMDSVEQLQQVLGRMFLLSMIILSSESREKLYNCKLFEWALRTDGGVIFFYHPQQPSRRRSLIANRKVAVRCTVERFDKDRSRWSTVKFCTSDHVRPPNHGV